MLDIFSMNEISEYNLIEKKPEDILISFFQTRKERNPSYSMSAFSRDLGISSSLLSRIINRTRSISLKCAMQISLALDLSDEESNNLLLSVVKNSTKNSKISKKVKQKFLHNLENSNKDSNFNYCTFEIEQFKAVAKWYHLAILNLVETEHFINCAKWISNSLEITPLEATDAINRMTSLGLLKEENGKLKRTEKNFFVKTQKSEFAVRCFHEQMINKGLLELKKTTDDDFHSRLINGITFSCGQEHIETIKDKIDKFEDEILKLTSMSSNNSIYQLNIQFFPLSRSQQ